MAYSDQEVGPRKEKIMIKKKKGTQFTSGLMVMMGTYKLSVLSPGVNCPWVAWTMKSPWFKAPLNQDRGLKGRQEAEMKTGTIQQECRERPLAKGNNNKKETEPTGHELQCPWTKAHPYPRTLRNPAVKKKPWQHAAVRVTDLFFHWPQAQNTQGNPRKMYLMLLVKNK